MKPSKGDFIKETESEMYENCKKKLFNIKCSQFTPSEAYWKSRLYVAVM